MDVSVVCCLRAELSKEKKRGKSRSQEIATKDGVKNSRRSDKVGLCGVQGYECDSLNGFPSMSIQSKAEVKWSLCKELTRE